MKWLLLVFTILLGSASLANAQALTLTYELLNEGETFMLYIDVQSEGRDRVYRSKMESIEQYYRYSPENQLVEWRYRDSANSTEYRALRKGDLIQVEGLLQGEELKTSFELESRPWLQNSEFGFAEFIESDERQMDFVFVKPDDVSLTRFRVKKGGTVKIPYGGGEVEALQLKANPPGILAALWHAYYWYSLPDHEFIKYKAEGAPGLPQTEIELVGRSGG
jgi:hypothetical protein